MSLIISRCLLASSQCDWSYAAVNAAAACATAAAAACATAAAASSKNCRKMSSSVGRTDQPGQRRWTHDIAVKNSGGHLVSSGGHLVSSGGGHLDQKRSETTQLNQFIHNKLDARPDLLKRMAVYYFNGEGKFIRPRLSTTMARAVNAHLGKCCAKTEERQRSISAITEMWHTSSLVHDDVIDHAETRRGEESVNCRWGARKSIFAGDYIVAVSNVMLAQTNDPEVISTMAQILADLVNGEFQQMGTREDEEDRFQLYLDKTFNKTASLIAYSCKAVALLGIGDDQNKEAGVLLADMAFNYGRDIGLAFQLIDDYLDFVASADQLGKPAGADLQLGLATAPVLFASREFPHIKELILRRFDQPGDVEAAFNIVLQSKGLAETKRFAGKYAKMALESISDLRDSTYKEELVQLAHTTVNRCS